MRRQLDVEHLCDFELHFEPPQLLTTPHGRRQIAIIKRGTMQGPRVKGTFLPGGGDWITLGTDGVAHLDVRASVRTDDGALIYVTNTGRAAVGPEAAARFQAGEMIRWDEMHARSSPLFETGDERYAWLNWVVTVAVNEFSMSQVNYRVYAVF